MGFSGVYLVEFYRIFNVINRIFKESISMVSVKCFCLSSYRFANRCLKPWCIGGKTDLTIAFGVYSRHGQ